MSGFGGKAVAQRSTIPRPQVESPLESAFTQSGHSNRRKSEVPTVCFRPGADVRAHKKTPPRGRGRRQERCESVENPHPADNIEKYIFLATY
jgi:hypothetical protein